MRTWTFIAMAWAGLATAQASSPSYGTPTLRVPSCPSKGTITYSTAMPIQSTFPKTQVDVCYTQKDLYITFTAYNETNYFFNPNYTTNDPIYEYEVMEAFLYPHSNAPSTYLEFEVSGLNQTFHSWIYNPSKVRAPGAPFTAAYITDPVLNGIVASTTLDKAKKKWVSDVKIPLAHFSVDQPKGTTWRANFFRTVVDRKTFPNQTLGAWSPNNEPNFHNSLRFGFLEFV